MPTPLLLIDVDGVLCPFFDHDAAPGYERLRIGPEMVWVNRQHGEWLRHLGGVYELVWATTWEHDAPRLLGPVLGLPEMRVIEFTQGAAGTTWKIADIDAFVDDRPLAWLDDELGPDAFAWAHRRDEATLLVRIDGAVGLTEEHVSLVWDFAETSDDG